MQKMKFVCNNLKTYYSQSNLSWGCYRKEEKTSPI
jgi:hypothetical protein